MTIKFSQPLNQINIGDVLRKKVALRLTQALKEETYLTNDGLGTFEVRNAIEVNYRNADEDNPVKVGFSWELVSID